MSKDNIEHFFHTPTKTLLFVINIPEITFKIKDKKEYVEYYLKLNSLKINLSKNDYGSVSNSVIYNDYEKYIDKIIHYIKSI